MLIAFKPKAAAAARDRLVNFGWESFHSEA